MDWKKVSLKSMKIVLDLFVKCGGKKDQLRNNIFGNVTGCNNSSA